MFRQLALILLAVTTTGATAFAGQYDYHPKTVLKLGGGFDPSIPSDTFRNCLTFTPKRIENTTVAATFDATIVKSRSQLLKVLNVSASLSGHYGLYGGGASYNYDEEYSFDTDSLTWAIVATNDYGRIETGDDAVPAPFAQKYLDAKQWTKFSDACGREVSTQERRIAKVAAIFSVYNLSESEKRDLTAKANFEGSGGGTWSASAQASYHQFVSQAMQLSTVKVSIVIAGGNGISILAGLTTDYSDLTKVSEAVRNYISQLSFDNSAPLSYATSNWKSYGWEGSQLDLTRQYEILGSLYTLYQDALRARNRVRSVLQTLDEPEYKNRLTPSERKTIEDGEGKISAFIEDVLARAEKCRKDQPSCKSTASLRVPLISWPNLLAVSRTQLLEVVYRGCNPSSGHVGDCQTQVELDVTYDTNVGDTMEIYSYIGPLKIYAVNERVTRVADTGTGDPQRSNIPKGASWKSEKIGAVLAGHVTQIILLIKDKQGVDELHHIALQ